MRNILIAGLSSIALVAAVGAATAQNGTMGAGSSSSGTMVKDRAGTTGSMGTLDRAPASSANSGVDRPSNSGGPATGASGSNPRTNDQRR